MSPKSLDELTADLKDEVMPTQSYDDLPEYGNFAEPPQPGPYRFQLPALDKVFELFDTEKGQRLRVIFDRDNPLLITSSPGMTSNGETFQTRLSNVKRKRGKDIETSDLDYLLKAFGMKSAPAGNKAYIEAIRQGAGKQFGADITYSFQCDTKRKARVLDEDGRSVELERNGCGERYYQKDLERVEGKFPSQIQCKCGAVLRTFANLENIRA